MTVISNINSGNNTKKNLKNYLVLLPVCEDKRVEDHHDINQAQGK